MAISDYFVPVAPRTPRPCQFVAGETVNNGRFFRVTVYENGVTTSGHWHTSGTICRHVRVSDDAEWELE